jgi:excisionase family DNA binding protein
MSALTFMGKNDHPTDLVTRLKQHSGAIRVSELARILTMSRTTVYQLVEAGRIPHYRIGESIRFDPVRIASWLAEQEVVA